MAVLNPPCAGEKNTLAMNNDKFDDEIQGLIDAGKEKGYLTYGDVNDMMPEEISSPERHRPTACPVRSRLGGSSQAQNDGCFGRWREAPERLLQNTEHCGEPRRGKQRYAVP